MLFIEHRLINDKTDRIKERKSRVKYSYTIYFYRSQIFSSRTSFDALNFRSVVIRSGVFQEYLLLFFGQPREPRGKGSNFSGNWRNAKTRGQSLDFREGRPDERGSFQRAELQDTVD